MVCSRSTPTVPPEVVWVPEHPARNAANSRDKGRLQKFLVIIGNLILWKLDSSGSDWPGERIGRNAVPYPGSHQQ